MSKLLDFFAGGAGNLVESIGSVVDTFTTTKAEKQELEIERMKAEETFKLENRKLDIQEQEMYIKDTADARDMQKQALKQDDKLAKRFIYYFTMGVTAISFAFLACMLFLEVPEKNQRLADVITGAIITTILGQIFNYWFGSSRGSSDKTEMLNLKKN